MKNHAFRMPYGQHHHHDDLDSTADSFGDGDPTDERRRGPGRGRGHRHGGGRGRPGSRGPGPGGPGFRGDGPGGRGRRRPKGAVREAVLSLLGEGPANGYSLMRQIDERTQGTWNPSPGSMYPALAQLVDEGLIEPTGSEKGTDFVLTDQGRSHVVDNAEAIGRVWADGSSGAPSHAQLRESMRALMGVSQQFKFATDEQRNRAAAQIDAARKALYGILAE